MKIVQAIGWYFPEHVGGTELYVAGLSQRLRAVGHTVLIAAPSSELDSERRYEHDGIRVYRYPTAAHPTREECQGEVPVRGAEHFHRWLAAERPDLVHFHTFVTGLGLPEVKAAKAAGARVIATTHASSLGFTCQRGTMMQWGRHACDGICEPVKCAACELQHRGLARLLAEPVARINPTVGKLCSAFPGRIGTALGMRSQIVRNQQKQIELLKEVDRFVLLTRWGFDVVASNGAPVDKLAVNRLGLGHRKLRLKPGPDEQPTGHPVRFGYLGRYDAVKGVRQLAEAIARLTGDLSARFEFRGPVTTATERALVQELKGIVGSDPRVHFEPAVEFEHVPQVLAGYDVLCCPSMCLEGGPTVAIEAHGVGTPVIGSRIGGLTELVTDGINGRLTTPGDVAALADAFAEIARDPAGTIDVWRRALPRARTMDEIAGEYLELYESCLGPRYGTRAC